MGNQYCEHGNSRWKDCDECQAIEDLQILVKRYEKALEEITRQYDNTSVNRAKEIANEALGELDEERRREIQSL